MGPEALRSAVPMRDRNTGNRHTPLRPAGVVAVAVAAVLALLAGSAGGETAASPFGPAPRGEDGRFLNAVGPIERVGPSVTIPFFMRRIAGSFVERPNAPERIANDGAWLRENAQSSEPSVTWVGHSTLLVQLGHATFLTDPIWSETASPVSFAGPRRHVAPGITINDLPPIDFVVISHNHYDHLDVDTLAELAGRSARTRFYVPLGNAEVLREAGVRNIQELDWGESVQHDAVRITCLPSQHWSARSLTDRMEALWSSWAVTAEDGRFYFGGDTGAFDGFRTIGEHLGPFDVAALPIGAYEPVAMMKPFHMNPEEAVEAGQSLRAERIVGIHFGTFDLTDEPLEDPPRRFLEAGRAAGYTDEALWLLKVGETRTF